MAIQTSAPSLRDKDTAQRNSEIHPVFGSQEHKPELSIVMPCLNEVETVGICVQKAKLALEIGGIAGEIIVADNGSSDGSQEIARAAGAHVIHVEHRGYGAALRAGIAAAHGRYIVMGDSDDSYDFREIGRVLDELRAGYDLVMGTRLKGTILPGAMPWLHRWIGNPALTALANLLFGTRLSDYHCGLRGFTRAAITELGLSTSGMEFASEMVAKAALHRLPISEVPITYHPDGRSRKPHLKTWHDGWRHLQFLLLLSPRWMLLYPALFLLIAGSLGVLWLLPRPRLVGSIGFDVHTLLVCGVSVIVGYQVLTLWLYAELFTRTTGLLPEQPLLRKLSARFSFGTGVCLSGILILVGVVLVFFTLQMWADVSFEALDYQQALRRLIPGVIAVALGMHTFFFSVVMSLLNFKSTFR